MSEFYKARRTKDLYSPNVPFRLSRSGIDRERCFYRNRKLGLNPPPSYPLTLNNAVDALMKREFDTHRMPPRVHRLVKEFGLELVPFNHKDLAEWRDAPSRGITYAQPRTNLVITGGVDDIWMDTNTNELTIVDYKATSTSKDITLDDAWKVTYKRQVEVYQWLFRRNSFNVSNTAYYVFVNGNRNADAFDWELKFEPTIVPYVGNDGWVQQAVMDAHACLNSSILPPSGEDCDACAYYRERATDERRATFS